MLSYLPAIFILGIALIIAFIFTKKRNPSLENQTKRNAAAKALSVAIILQCIHFTEEAFTGFNIRLGELVNIPGMPYSFFVIFNLLWIGIWMASVPGIRSGHSAAFFAAWFLAVTGVFNGFLHPLLSIMSGSYFPGTISSSFVAAACIWLWLKLNNASE
jgi:hypothetical protein